MQTTTVPPFNTKKAQNSSQQKWYVSYGLVTLGSLILAIGLVFFIVPFKFVPGGIYGVSILLNKLTGWPIGLLSLGINIPLVIIGIKVLGAHFGVKTIYSMIVTSFFIDILQELLKVSPLTSEALVGAIFGGVLIGLGISLVIRGDATTGGTDIIAQLIAKYTRLPVGKLFLGVDSIIVASGIIVFMDLDSAPYAIIVIFVISRTIDYMISGFDNRKAVFVISDKYDEVRKFILNDLDRTGTYLLGKGLYFAELDKKIIFTALTRKELVRLQKYVARIDSEAFVMAINTNEVFGSGFKPLE